MNIPGLAQKAVESVWKRQTAPGALPGTVRVDPRAPKPVVDIMAYDGQSFVEHQVDSLQAVKLYLSEWPVTWVNVEGLGGADVIEELGRIFDLHGLALEDVVNVHQRPKVDEYPDHLFIVARMIYLNTRVESEQLSLFLGPNFVVTFQSVPGDCLDPVRDRIRRGLGRIRHAGPDYLAYAILDSVIDAYFPVLDYYSNELESLENEVIECATPRTVSRIHQAKRNLLYLRRVLWPLRDALAMLIREPSHLIASETHIFLRDCYDHTVQLIDLLENYREVASGLMEVYLSSVSNRMNEIMKVLTIIATIFMPLSFLAAVYGMNFNTGASPVNMPELNWYWGYPFALLVMGATAIGLLIYFWRKGWLRSHCPRVEPSDAEECLGSEDGHQA